MNLNDSSSDESSSSGAGSGAHLPLLLLPFSAAGALALVAKQAVLASMESLFGAGLLAATATNALWVIGVVVVLAIGVLLIATIINLLAAIVFRDVLPAIVGGLGILYFAMTYALAVMVFGNLPLLVGFVLGSSLLFYPVLVIIGGVVLAIVPATVDV